jgi:hypothetical protein
MHVPCVCAIVRHGMRPLILFVARCVVINLKMASRNHHPLPRRVVDQYVYL